MPEYFSLPITQSTFTASAYRNPTWGKKRKRAQSGSPSAASANATTGAEDDSEHDTPAASSATTQRPRRLNLKQTHFTLLNTLLHRTMHSGDFTRASRAFALLIRTRFGTVTPRMRAHGLWGLGVEILLHRDAAATAAAAAAEDNDENDDNGPDAVTDTDTNTHNTAPTARPFAEPAFANAIALLERLIQQHPWTRFREAHDVSSLHFYPVLLGLWVYQVDARSQDAQRRVRQQQQRQQRGPQDDDGEQAASARAAGATDAAAAATAAVARIRAAELASAREIAARIERVAAGPPFDRDAAMQRMRGMVALWIAGLLGGKEAGGAGEDAVRDDDGGGGGGGGGGLSAEGGEDEGNGHDRSRGEGADGLRRAEIRAMYREARDAFRRARWTYPGVWDGDGSDNEDGDEEAEAG